MTAELTPRLHERLRGKKHVIWDWNGTLLDDVDHSVATINFFLREQGLATLDRESYRQVFQFPIRTYYEKLGFDFMVESFESLCDRFVDWFMQGMSQVALFPETRATLAALQLQGVQLSILSASDQQSLDRVIEQHDLAKFFDAVYGIADRFASSKVARGRELLRKSRISAEETVLVGDTLHDLEVAQAIGIDAILLGVGHQCPQRLALVHPHVLA